MQRYPATLTCPGGLETLLVDEAGALGFRIDGQTRGAVTGEGDPESLYRICLWSRIAGSVLLRIVDAGAVNADALYERLSAVAWEDWMPPHARFVISASGSSPLIANAQHAVFRVKDAIVDRAIARGRPRPSVERERPDIRFHLHLAAEGASVYLDLAGSSLHERGYRVANVEAPLKENLAAALVAWSGIGVGVAAEAVVDPFCGGGTLLVEAAWAAGDVAPGLLRRHWGFEKWTAHQPETWRALLREAETRRIEGLARRLPKFVGFDADPQAVRAAQANVAAAGLRSLVHVERQSIAQFTRSGRVAAANGIVLANPPYGERLSADDAARYLYRCLGRRLRTATPGWRAVVLGASIEHLDELRAPDFAQHRCFNGPIPCFARAFTVPAEPEAAWPPFRLRGEATVEGEGVPLANRLQKNWKGLRDWVTRENIRAFRLYDADLPEFNVAVDVYGDRLHVQEYAAPSTVDPDKAAHRLSVALDAIAKVSGRAPSSLALKVRSRQKGKTQYRRQDDRGEFYEVEEHGARLLVNLTDYLDTGLFLDHRPLRRRLQALCAGKHFLNLFCYTGSATVHAAVGGARSSVSVDLNPRYLEWAEANLALNGFSIDQHRLVRADAGSWLARGGDQFDVIFLDAPTFSNSRRTENVLDIQRDHPALVRQAMRHLARDGVLLFSNNYRRFRLDESLAAEFDVLDITTSTIPRDFERNPKIHACWEVRHRA